jgi:hypothetical protein
VMNTVRQTVLPVFQVLYDMELWTEQWCACRSVSCPRKNKKGLPKQGFMSKCQYVMICSTCAWTYILIMLYCVTMCNKNYGEHMQVQLALLPECWREATATTGAERAKL